MNPPGSSSVSPGVRRHFTRELPLVLNPGVVAQPLQRPDRDMTAPIVCLGRRPGEPVEHPSAIVELLGLDDIQVTIYLRLPDECAGSTPRERREVERAQRLSLATNGRNRQ